MGEIFLKLSVLLSIIGYWHQVRSWGYMNSAVSIWFSQLKNFTDQGCDKVDVAFTPMDQVMVLWRYPGYGNLTQGHMDIHILRRFLLTLADSEGKIWLDDLVSKYFVSEHDGKKDVMRRDEQERAREVSLIISRFLLNYQFYVVTC